MASIGSVLFSASEGYDAEVWDDTALIQEYDRAWKSSRELVRKRQERAGGKKSRVWQIGDACRSVFSEDGEEYEGTVVFKNTANRSVTVRFHGYNNEEEVKERELMDSLGQDEVEQQVEQAKLDEEAEEEEEGAGDDFQLGDWCRAEWSHDGVVYEGIIESLDRKSRNAKVKFLGFGNVEEKSLDELFLSKGEEWRAEQENIGKVEGNGQGIKEEDLHNLIAKNCPDLLANFGDAGELGLEGLEIGGKKKKDKKDKKDKKEKKEKKEKTDKEKKDKREKKSKRNSSPSRSSQSSSQAAPEFSQSSRSSTQAPPDQIPAWFPPTSLPLQSPYHLPSQFPSYPSMNQTFPSMPPISPYPDPYQNQFSSSMQPPFLPFPPQLQHPPSCLPPPPSLTPSEATLVSDNSSALHSMMMSWYMAGYHSGVFEGIKQAQAEKKKERKK